MINEDGAGAEVNGLQLATGSGGSEIRGLEIRDFFSGAGIRIVSANNTIASNTIHSVNDGIVISGTTASGNVVGNDVEPSELALVDYELGNVLVEADGSGLEILDGATGTVVAGNFIGTDRAGATDRGNGSNGIHVEDASNNQLGPGNTVARTAASIRAWRSRAARGTGSSPTRSITTWARESPSSRVRTATSASRRSPRPPRPAARRPSRARSADWGFRRPVLRRVLQERCVRHPGRLGRGRDLPDLHDGHGFGRNRRVGSARA